MPLARFELKNEYGLGDPRLYLGATTKKDDSRIVLDGLAVSGLVGILRQLGDLAEFAAIVFHDVHQEVVTTAARGLKVLNRIQKIESALPQLEQAIQGQKSHIHFAYIAGRDWHTNIQTGQRQFFGSDLPEFIMDSYEECRDPPRLHLLDKFDSAGAGACLKRYSDPSYFRRVKASLEPIEVEKVQNGMKIQRKKKQRSRGRSRLAHHSTVMTLNSKSLNSSMQFASLVTDELSFSVDDASISDTLSKSDYTNELRYLSSNKRSDTLEAHNRPSSMSKELYGGMTAAEIETEQRVDFTFINHIEVSASKNIKQDSLCQQSVPLSSSILCYEKTEIMNFANQTLHQDIPKDEPKNSNFAEDSPALSNQNHETDGLWKEKHVLRSLSWDESITNNHGALAETVSTFSSTMSKENATDNFETRSSTSSTALDENARRTDGLATQEEHVYTSFSSDENATDNLVVSAETISSTCYSMSNENTTVFLETRGSKSSAAWDEKAQILEPKSHSFADCIIPDRPQVSDSLFFILETSNQQCDTADTEMIKQDDVLPNSKKMVVSSPGGQLGNCRSQLDKYLDATDALDSRAQTAFVYQAGGVSSLPYQCCDELGCEINKIQAVAAPNMDIVNGEMALRPYTALFENLYPQGLGHSQSVSSAEFAHSLHCSVENSVFKSLVCDITTINDSKGSSDALCPEITIPSTQAVASFGIPVEESFLQDSFSDTFAETASEEAVYCEQQTKHETGSMSNLNCQWMESQRNMKTLMVTSKSYGLGSETHVASCSSLDDSAFPVLSDLMNSSSVDSISSSILSSDEASSRNHINKFLPRNNSEGPDGNMLSQLTSTSGISTSDITTTTEVDFRGIPVDTISKRSINIWTNGGLLGLEPSKPPDISVLNMHDCDNMYENRSATKAQPGVVCFTEKDSTLGKICDAQSNSMLSKLHSKDTMQASSVGNLDKGQNAYSGSAGLHIDKANNKGETICSGADMPSSNEAESTESRQNHSSISAGFSKLAHRFLVNSLQRRSSMTVISPLSELVNSDVLKLHGNSIYIKHNERSKQAISSSPSYFLESEGDIEHGFSEKLLSSSLNTSGYCSPPLEHMRSSFQPMKDLDTSSLKLEYCNAHPLGNMGDTMFPSFQLSESFQPLLDDVLDSDDDTFCRSCFYSSDDLISLNSKSDAEMWGEDEMDVSDRMVATGPIPSSIESDLGNGFRESLVNNISNLKYGSAKLSVNPGDIEDLLNISSLEVSERQLCTHNPSTGQTYMSSLPNEQKPSSPSPPTKSRVMKPSFTCVENTSREVKTDSSLDCLPVEISAEFSPVIRTR